MRIIPIFAVAALASIVAAGCGSSDTTSADDTRTEASAAKTTIVASFYPLAWVAEQLGGDNVEVINLTPPGVEPHDLELAPKDAAKLSTADVVLFLGGGFQPAVEDAVANTDARVIDVLTIDGLKFAKATADDGHDHGHDDAGEQPELDPHVWLDPTRLATIARHVATELKLDANDVATQLETLDTELQTGLTTCARREIITSHAAFSYLADRYRLEQIAISGVSGESEPRPQDLKRVADEARRHGATTIFFESLASPKLSEQVARTVGAKTATLDPLEGISEERLADGADYFTVMRENLQALRTGLDCS